MAHGLENIDGRSFILKRVEYDAPGINLPLETIWYSIGSVCVYIVRETPYRDDPQLKYTDYFILPVSVPFESWTLSKEQMINMQGAAVPLIHRAEKEHVFKALKKLGHKRADVYLTEHDRFVGDYHWVLDIIVPVPDEIPIEDLYNMALAVRRKTRLDLTGF